MALDPDRPVTFAWVKGHSGDRMNDLVDLLATQAAAGVARRPASGRPRRAGTFGVVAARGPAPFAPVTCGHGDQGKFCNRHRGSVGTG